MFHKGGNAIDAGLATDGMSCSYLKRYKSGKLAIIEPRSFYIEADAQHRFVKAGAPNRCRAFIPENFSQTKVGDSIILDGDCERHDSAEDIINAAYPEDGPNVIFGYDEFRTGEEGETYVTRIYSASCTMEVLKVADCLDAELEEVWDLSVKYKTNDRDRGVNYYIKDRGKTYLCSNTELDDFRQEIRKKWSEGK